MYNRNVKFYQSMVKATYRSKHACHFSHEILIPVENIEKPVPPQSMGILKVENLNE